MQDKLTSIHYAGDDWELLSDELDLGMLGDLLECCPPGMDAEPAVDDFMANWGVSGNPKDCRDMLYGYGAWDDDELADHNANLKRLVWLTAGSFNDGESAHFSTY